MQKSEVKKAAGIASQPQNNGVVSPLKKFNLCITNERMQKYLESILGERKASFVNNVVALVSSDAKLQRCDANSTIYACLKATALNLPLDKNLGFSYVIPYKDVATFQIGYKGYIQMAIRTGQYRTINVTDIREGELVETDLLSGDMELKRAEHRESKPVIGYAAYIELTNGFKKSLYMTKEEVFNHGKKYSKSFGGLWYTDFDSMAKKTVLKMLLSKYSPLSVEMQSEVGKKMRALAAENGSDLRISSGSPYADDDEIEYADEAEEVSGDDDEKPEAPAVAADAPSETKEK